MCNNRAHLTLDVLESLDLTMDENKENQTPEAQELDWVQQYSLDQEREEQELQQALAQSLQEHVCNTAVTKPVKVLSHTVRLTAQHCHTQKHSFIYIIIYNTAPNKTSHSSVINTVQ